MRVKCAEVSIVDLVVMPTKIHVVISDLCNHEINITQLGRDNKERLRLRQIELHSTQFQQWGSALSCRGGATRGTRGNVPQYFPR